jgi:preprotein translocase subunit SecA
MSHDKIGDRFSKRQNKGRLDETRRKNIDPDLLEEEDKILADAEPVEPIEADKTPGRNDPCPCGSGKKYKKCCALKQD